MRQHSYRLIASLAFAVPALSAGPAVAQIDPFPGRDLTTTASDLAVIEEVAGGLIGGRIVPNGTKVEWYNGETHRRGTIEVLLSSELDGRPCHMLRYTLPTNSVVKSRAYDLNWCKMADGDWKIVSK